MAVTPATQSEKIRDALSGARSGRLPDDMKKKFTRTRLFTILNVLLLAGVAAIFLHYHRDAEYRVTSFSASGVQYRFSCNISSGVYQLSTSLTAPADRAVSIAPGESPARFRILHGDSVILTAEKGSTTAEITIAPGETKTYVTELRRDTIETALIKAGVSGSGGRSALPFGGKSVPLCIEFSSGGATGVATIMDLEVTI